MHNDRKTLIGGLVFPEGPRWHDGRLFFSDMHDKRVLACDESGRAELVVEVPACPSGLGWLPDGRMLVVSMEDRRLLRLDPGGLAEVADLKRLARELKVELSEVQLAPDRDENLAPDAPWQIDCYQGQPTYAALR